MERFQTPFVFENFANFNERVSEIGINLFGGRRLVVDAIEGERFGRVIDFIVTRWYGQQRALQRRSVDLHHILITSQSKKKNPCFNN